LPLLLAVLSFGAALSSARAADEPADSPRISVVDGRIEVHRSTLAAPEISAYVQGPGGELGGPALPGRRTIVETTILGQDSEWGGGLKPRLRLGYGAGDGANPATSYRDVYIRGVLIKEFW
jgi:hypothetical protein